MSEEKQAHRWVKHRRYPWHVCARCDLVALKNEATARRMKASCTGQLVVITAPKSQNQRDAEAGR